MNAIPSTRRASRRRSSSPGGGRPARALGRRATRSRLRIRLRAPRGFSFVDHGRESLIALVIAYVFGGMPVLWNLMPQVSPFVFTALGSVSLAGLAVVARSWRLPDRRLLIAVLAYLGLYIAFSYLSYASSGARTGERWSMLQTNTMVLAMGVFYFLGGSVIARQRRWGVTAGLIAAYAFIALYALAYRDVLTSMDLLGRLRRDGDMFDYQQVGDSFALVSLALMARWHLRAKTISWRGWLLTLAFVGFSLVVLFIVPSRSAAFLGASCLLLALVMRARGWWRIVMAALVVIAGIVIAMQPVGDLAEGSRFESLVESNQEDQSVQGREEILEEGWKVIGEHPLLGSYAFELERMGRSGLYIHNALDIWAQAGILPFTAFIVLWCLLLWRLVKTWRASPRRMAATLPLVAFALLSWVISRNAAYVLPMLGLGFFAAQVAYVRSRSRSESTRPRRSRRSRRSRLRTLPAAA